MPVLSKESFLRVKVVDMFYCGVVVKVKVKDTYFYFVIEKYPHNKNQNTTPVDDAPATEAWPDRSNVNMADAEAYWTSHDEKNADGSRKGGAFSLANLSLNRIPIGATLNVEIVENTDINTVVMVRYGEAPPFKAFACSKPSPQRATDTYIMTKHNAEEHVRVIKRSPPGDKGPDFPHGWAVIGGFQDGGKSVEKSRAAELQEEGGIVIGNKTIKKIKLPNREEPGREPRYMPFSYLGPNGIVVFGCERGSTADSEIRWVISKDTTQLPRLAEATDKDEVVKGKWMLVEEFLALSNDPAAENYAPWIDHQAGVRDAVQMLRELKLV